MEGKNVTAEANKAFHESRQSAREAHKYRHCVPVERREVTDEDVTRFIAQCEKISDQVAPGSYCKGVKLGFQRLKTNYRVFTVEEGQARSVHCFIEIATGDVMKGSWKAPVKNGVRGNIFEEDVSRFIGWMGPKYVN